MGICAAIIPARAGSKGIKNKNIIEFCGRPLIVWSIEQALKSKSVDRVFVSTDGGQIVETAKKAGAEIIWRPKEISGDISSSEEALIHAVNSIEKETEIDKVVFLQATSPLRTSEDIDGAVETFLEGRFDSLFSMAVLDDYCIWHKTPELDSLTYDYRKRGRRQERKPMYLENGSIYVFKKEILLKYHNRLGGKIGMYEMPFNKSYEIDSLRDLEICEIFMRYNNTKKG